MARAKREYEGLLAAWQVSEIVRHIPFTGRALDPNAINPFRVRTEGARSRMDEVRRFRSSRAMHVQAQKSFEAAERKAQGQAG